MANTFKNYFAKDVGTSASTVLTASTSTTVIGMTVANTSAAAITVDVYITSSTVNYYLVKNAVVPIGGSLVPIGGNQKVVLETGDAIKVLSNTATSADAILAVLEIT